MLEQAKEGLLAQASGYLSESLWVLVLEDLMELESTVLPKRSQSFESTILNVKKCKVYHVYIKIYLLTSLVGAGVGAGVGGFEGDGVGCITQKHANIEVNNSQR